VEKERSEDIIELRVEDIAQLFHTLDPFPFRERDLDREAEDFIVGWAQELARKRPIRILVHFPDIGLQRKAAEDLMHALARYFSDRALAAQREINELFRIGRVSLVIGASVLVICLSAQFWISALLSPPWLRLVEESLLILGWVANWRPLEIFLYDWWPLRRRRELYRRLSNAVVETRPYPAKEKAGDRP
jgi:hypothetical protein